jgi:hypothetical protein
MKKRINVRDVCVKKACIMMTMIRDDWYIPFLAFFARIDPAQSIANPVCMKLRLYQYMMYLIIRFMKEVENEAFWIVEITLFE